MERCYFFAFFAVPALAAARRSVFLRREARFLTLSLPWLFPIRATPSLFRGRFQVISHSRGRCRYPLAFLSSKEKPARRRI